MGEHLIKVENLTLSYENMTVVKDLSFTVESGDYLCIVGENGSGKSTLVKSLLSLKKPVGGEITFGGGLRRNEIGYLPQQTGAQHDFPASVGEVVISGCLNSMGFRPFYTDRWLEHPMMIWPLEQSVISFNWRFKSLLRLRIFFAVA